MSVTWATAKFQYFVIFGGDFGETRNVKFRNLPFLWRVFVENALVLAVAVLKTGGKQQETKEQNLNFPKHFSDWKNIEFQEN